MRKLVIECYERACVRVCVHVYVWCLIACVRACVCVRDYICVPACAYTCVHDHAYTYTSNKLYLRRVVVKGGAHAFASACTCECVHLRVVVIIKCCTVRQMEILRCRYNLVLYCPRDGDITEM